MLVADESVFRKLFAIDVRTLTEAISISPEDKTVERGSVSLDNLAKEAGSRDDAMRPEAS